MKQNIVQQKLLRVEKSEKYYSGNNIIQIIYKSTAQMKYKHLNIPKMHINTFIHTHRFYKNQNT